MGRGLRWGRGPEALAVARRSGGVSQRAFADGAPRADGTEAGSTAVHPTLPRVRRRRPPLSSSLPPFGNARDTQTARA